MPTPGNADGAASELAAAHRRGWLAAICTVGFGLRIFRIDWGLPDFVFNDTRIHFIEVARNAVGSGDWILQRFVHPPFYPYLITIVTWLWATVTGNTVEIIGPDASADRATIVLIGRVITVIASVFLIGATYLLGKRLLGTRAGLWAAAFVALNPLQVIESHRINVDAPMLLLAVLSAHQATVAVQERNRSRLLFSFALAAFSGAVKYTGLFIGTLPIWVALRWPESSWRQRFRTIVAGGLLSLATFTLAMSPVALNWEVFTRQLYQLFYIGIFEGAPGQDLTGGSWVFAPYLYMTIVGLPFMLGWPVFIAGVLGIVVLAFTNRRALSLITAAALPFYVLQGNAETTVARYYLPLMPFLAITGGGFVVWARSRLSGLGTALAAIILLYSAILTFSQANRIGGAPQAAIARRLEQLAAAKRDSGISLRAVRQPKLVVGYPFWAPSIYDAIFPYIRKGPTRELVYIPPELRFPGDAVEPAQALREDRKWVEETGVDAIIVTSRWENIRLRNSFLPREEQFYQHLVGGRLGLRLVADEETSYFTQSWYEWADPTLDTIWTAGIGGYKLYVRDDLLPALADR